MAQRSTPAAGKAPNVAIVGGGLVGVMLGVSLAHRGIPFTLYERASGFHEIGAGIALLTVARDTMKRLNPATYEALSRVATKNYWKYWDGCSPRTKEAAHGPEAFQFLLDGEGNEYWCCLRSVLLRELVAMLPEGSTVFNKELDSYVDDPKSPKVVLRFKDGTSVETDALLGCDGIHSRTRQLLLGEDNPAAFANFTHQVGYRTVLSLDDAIETLGPEKGGEDFSIHIGPGCYIPSYPMINGEERVLNIATVIYTPGEWTFGEKMVAPATREEVTEVFKDWSPPMRDLVSRFPEKLMKWGIFDMCDHPAPTYAGGRVCIVGDAAHASTPFLGAGGAMGFEDVLALTTALEIVTETSLKSMPAALLAYSAARKERSQALVKASRGMGVVFQWRDSTTGNDPAKLKADADRRTKAIWEYSVDGLINQVRDEFKKYSA